MASQSNCQLLVLRWLCWRPWSVTSCSAAASASDRTAVAFPSTVRCVTQQRQSLEQGSSTESKLILHGLALNCVKKCSWQTARRDTCGRHTSSGEAPKLRPSHATVCAADGTGEQPLHQDEGARPQIWTAEAEIPRLCLCAFERVLYYQRRVPVCSGSPSSAARRSGRWTSTATAR